MTRELSYTGFYHPECPFIPDDMNAYMAWYESHALQAGKPFKQSRAGVFFSRHQVARNHLAGIDALIRELESRDIIPVPLFSQQKEHAGGDCPGYNVDLAQLKGVDVVINCVSSFLFQTDMTARNTKTVLDVIDAPVFQAVASTGRTEDEWRRDPQGITAMNQVYWVSQPEFNGTIEPAVLFAKGEDEPTSPIMDRISFFVRRIKNWLYLKAMPKQDRKVTILLHNNPCAGTEASLGGASGLDSFESVVRLMRYLAEQGYMVDTIPENGKALSDEFLKRKAVSEFRWTTVDEIVDKGGAAVFIDPETYDQYFNALSPENRKKMIENWGEPPGQSMVYKGSMVVTGLTFGNIRVMAEPKRGCYGSRCDGEVCKILHNPEIPPTHQCYATFKWITDETDPLGCCYNDFQGGMTAAVRALSNMTPKVLWGDTKDPANPKVRELREEIERVVRVKLLNPQWIEGMKRHGYKGAQGMAHKAACVYGWDATSDVVDDWIFDELTKKHVLDPDMRAFYKENNPWALEELARRFLEAEQRGLWNADPEVLSELREHYLEIEGWIEETMGDTHGEFQGGSVDILTRNDVKEWDGRLRFNIDEYLRVP